MVRGRGGKKIDSSPDRIYTIIDDNYYAFFLVIYILQNCKVTQELESDTWNTMTK